MEKKKRTGKWSYSTSGKCIRGLLLIVTFAVFVASFIVVAYAMDAYGEDILVGGMADFNSDAKYVNDLENDIGSLIRNIQKLYYGNTLNPGVVGVADLESGESLKYNLKEISNYKNEWLAAGDLDFGNYAASKGELINCRLADYGNVRETLAALSKDNDYLRLSAAAFKNLFIENGLRNSGKRFSDDFSEKAYFIFPLNEDIGAYLTEKERQERGESDTDSEEPTDVSGREMFFAVYDPDEDVFYTPSDQYFAPVDYYIYDLRELEGYLDSEDPYGQNYDSIIIPLLGCYNYSTEELIYKLVADCQEAAEAQKALDKLCDAGLYYYYVGSKEEYSNLQNLSEVTSMPVSYEVVMDSLGNGIISLDGGEVMEISLTDIPFEKLTGDRLYVGFDVEQRGKEVCAVVTDYQESFFLSQSVRNFGIAAVLSWLLFVVQFVWLIKTTGKSSPESGEIQLYRFDRIYTELWLLSVFAMAAACLTFSLFAVNHMPLVSGLVGTVIGSLFVVLPIGLCIMVFTLSFVRRVKAHNFMNSWYIGRLFSKDNKRLFAIVNAFKRMRGTTRLAMWFAVYLIINLCCGYCQIYLSVSEDLFLFGLLVYILIQVFFAIKVAGMIRDTKKLIAGVEEITKGNLDYQIEMDKATGVFKELTDGINHIGNGLKAAVEMSLKDERMKTELITNVSHDLKTPLTSIINYINLLKTEKMPTPEAEHYIEVLETKAERLKQLTEDLVEAAKATSGNIELEMMPLAFDELMKQALGEFEDKFADRDLKLIANYTDQPALVLADGKRLYRVIENVLQNVYKYAQPGTRVYADLNCEEKAVIFMLRNISSDPLNISPEELMERFVRGDSSRTTEGSGLGLSIAKDLTSLQGGSFEIRLDGDLFKVIISFPRYEKTEIS